jgi:hypothetical protein
MTLIIMVIACATVPKYYNYILKIEQTWGKRAQELGVKILYFLGEEPTDLVGDQYIYLKGVANDYLSASYKQNLGLQYIHQHYQTQWVYCCGSDTYVNVDKMLQLVNKYDYHESIMFGGHILSRQTLYHKLISFSGGGGLILSIAAIDSVAHQLENMVANWTTLCQYGGCPYLIPACDICLGYYVEQNKGHLICYQNRFTGCNHHGEPSCCVNKTRHQRIIACHYMTPSDFDDFHSILDKYQHFRNFNDYPKEMTPNCTVVTSCQSRAELEHFSEVLTRLPCYMIIYCHCDTIHELINLRDKHALNHLTINYCLPEEQITSDLEYLSQYKYKYKLIEKTIKNNPFDTNRFMWIDCHITGQIDQLLKIADQEGDHFHYYVTHFSNKISHISSSLFTCHKDSAVRIMTKLLDEIAFNDYDDQTKVGYGSQEHIIDNFLQPMQDHEYIYSSIMSGYQDSTYYKHACRLGMKIISLIDHHKIYLEPSLLMKIIYCFYVSAFYHNPPMALDLIQRILSLRQENDRFEQAYQEYCGFYDEQLSYVKYLKLKS